MAGRCEDRTVACVDLYVAQCVESEGRVTENVGSMTRGLPAGGDRTFMQRPVDGADSVRDYMTRFAGILPAASQECPCCDGHLKGHGRYSRWVVSLAGVFRIPIQRMICKKCRGTFSLLPRFLYAFYQCTRSFASKIKSLWDGGRHAMSDVRYMLSAERSGLNLASSSLYRWASLPAE